MKAIFLFFSIFSIFLNAVQCIALISHPLILQKQASQKNWKLFKIGKLLVIWNNLQFGKNVNVFQAISALKQTYFWKRLCKKESFQGNFTIKSIFLVLFWWFLRLKKIWRKVFEIYLTPPYHSNWYGVRTSKILTLKNRKF